MKLCIPRVGTRLLLTKPWTLKIYATGNSVELVQLKICPKVKQEGKQTTYTYPNGKHNWSNAIPHETLFDYYRIPEDQEITFPVGTVLKVEYIETTKRYPDSDHVIFSVNETPLEYEQPPLETCSYKIKRSPKSKRKTVIKFYAKPDNFNDLEFEFAI